MAGIAPVKSRMPRCILLFMYQSAPVWFWVGFWLGFFLTELSRKCLGCQSQSISLSKQEGAGEHHGTIPFLSLGTTAVSSSAPPSALVRRDCHGHPLADFIVSSGLTLKKQNTARYLSLSFATGCPGTFSSHPLARMVHQRHGQAASVFCLLTQAPCFSSAFHHLDRWYVV